MPWLILLATAVFAQGSLGTGVLARGRFRLSRPGVYAVQGLVSVYGGYFGGGIGIMMLAALILFGLTDMRVMNAIKIFLAMLMNVAAVATFMVAGLVHWPQTLILMAGRLAISSDLYEAASVDGASPLQKFMHITWPSMQTL